MRRSVMQHGFINRIRCLVGEDTSRKERHQLFDLVDTATFHDIVVDEDIFSKEFNLLLHIGKQSPDFGGQM